MTKTKDVDGSRASALLSDVAKFRESKEAAEQSVRAAFPLGSRVRVQLEHMPVEAVVHCYVADSPDRLGILFENGNVWDKPIESVELIG